MRKEINSFRASKSPGPVKACRKLFASPSKAKEAAVTESLPKAAAQAEEIASTGDDVDPALKSQQIAQATAAAAVEDPKEALSDRGISFAPCRAGEAQVPPHSRDGRGHEAFAETTRCRRCSPTPWTRRFPSSLPSITTSAALSTAEMASSWQAQTAGPSSSPASSTTSDSGPLPLHQCKNMCKGVQKFILLGMSEFTLLPEPLAVGPAEAWQPGE